MPGPAALCCCASSAWLAPELQAGCLRLSLLPRILVCNCLVLLPALLLLSLWVQEDITVPHTLWLCKYFSRVDTSRFHGAGMGRFEASQVCGSRKGKAGTSEVGTSGPGRCQCSASVGPLFQLQDSPQAEFLTEIGLFSPFVKAKGLISLKDFSSPIIADHTLTPSTPALWSLTMPATLCDCHLFGQN